LLARTIAAVALAAVPLAVACSIGTSADDGVPVIDVTEPIITGVKDTGHPAVVSLFMTKPGAGGANEYSGCTGTIVSVNPATKIGYVLTAAHCTVDATAVSVTQGSDKTALATLVSYGFIDHFEHPSYDRSVTSPYDVAMIRVLGVDANTPVVPMLSPDNMVQGQTHVTSVGFGQTIRPDVVTDAGSNTAKNRIDGVVASLTSTAVGVRYDNSGDICHGDSGGPVLTTVGGKEYVAAVHSYVTGPCVGLGYSVRASAHKAFYQTIMSKPAPAASCDICKKTVTSGTNACGEARRACYNDAQCNGLRQCIAACTTAGGDAGPSDDCKKQCSVEFPFGAAPYNTQLVFCACNACEAACTGDSTCAAVPQCGMAMQTTTGASAVPTAEACNACMNGSCCAEQEACGKDGHCYRCVRTPETPGCATDALYTRLQACRAAQCRGQCQ
jgi:hypothetical protein